jgi:peptide/nickel transport system substrate-binding protein
MWVAAAVTALAVLLTGCSGQSDTPTDEKTVLTTAQASPPMSLDPYLSEGGGYYPYLSPIYDSLILWTADGQFAPGLATEWSYSADALSFTMKLREGVTFSDGAAFNAEVAKANLDRAATVTGPRTAQLAPVTSITVDDEYVVTLHLASPLPSLETLLADVLGMMVSPNSLADPNANPIGTGPYVLNMAETILDDSYKFELRSDYWDAGHYHFAEYVVRVIPDSNTMYQALKAGEIDYMGAQPSQATQATADGFQVVRSPVNFAAVFLYDRGGTMVPALGDVRVRQALNYAVDREAIMQAAAAGYGTVTSQLVPPGIEGHVDALDTYYTYDPEKAKTLLAEAGYADGFTLKVTAAAFLNGLVPAQLFSSYLAAIGVTVEIDEAQPADFIPAMLSGSTPAAQFLWGLQDVYLDSYNLTDPSGAFNPFSCDDDEINDLIARAAVATPEERVKLYQQWNETVVSKGWFVITHFQDLVIIASDSITDVSWWPARATASIRDWKPKA